MMEEWNASYMFQINKVSTKWTKLKENRIVRKENQYVSNAGNNKMKGLPPLDIFHFISTSIISFSGNKSCTKQSVNQ